jgi:hypothetical protein
MLIYNDLSVGSGKTMIALVSLDFLFLVDDLTINRTAVVEAAKYRYSELRAPIVVFYCENEHYGSLQASYILSSFIKQLCEFLRYSSRPFPEDIIRKVRRFFGHDRTAPDFEDLKDIFILLFYYVPNTIYVLDGFDALNQEHIKGLLTFIRPLFCDPKPPQGSRILLLSREQIPGYINITTFMPGTCQISTSVNVMRDIQIYIETSVDDKTMCRKLTDDRSLLDDIKRVLLTESSGMYDNKFHTL